MKDFDALFSAIPLTKILNYHQYRLSMPTSKFNCYKNVNEQAPIFLFNDIDAESLQAFDGLAYKKVSKAELFLSLNKPESLVKALQTIERLNSFTPEDNNSNLSTAITVNTLTNLIAGLIEPDLEILPIIKTPQFKNRIFLTRDGFYKTPLFYYHLDQAVSNRIINYVEWNETEIRYLNSNSYCLNASYYQPENKYLFITSNPRIWVEFPTIKHSPDFFQILSHPWADNQYANLVHGIFAKYQFSKFFVHLTDEYQDNTFACKLLSHFLNQLVQNFFFVIEFSGQRFSIQTSYLDKRELNIKLAKIFSEVSYEIKTQFLSQQQEPIEVSKDLDSIFNIESNKSIIGEKVYTTESIGRNKQIAALFFNTLLKTWNLNNKIEVLVF